MPSGENIGAQLILSGSPTRFGGLEPSAAVMKIWSKAPTRYEYKTHRPSGDHVGGLIPFASRSIVMGLEPSALTTTRSP